MKLPGVFTNKLYLGAAAVVIAAVAVGSFMMSGQGKAKVGKYDWEYATVEKGDVSRIISASGAVQPVTQVDVGSQVSGRIVQLYVDYNSPVKKDMILAKIDPESFQSAVNSAQARVLQSEASLANAKSAIDRSTVSLSVAKSNYDRNKKLFAEQAISQAAWETADQTYKLAVVQLDTDKASMKSAEAGLAMSRAQLRDAQVNLERTNIRSPIDGVIVNRAVQIGQTVQSSMTVAKFFTIAQDLSQIQIEASVVEGDISGIDPGDPVTFSVDAQQGRRFQGEVKQVRKLGTEVANVVTYTVVIGAGNPNNVLLPGMTANVDIVADRATGVLRIANDATRFQPPKELAEALNKKEGGASQGGQQRQNGGAPGAGNGPQVASFGGGAPGGAPNAGQGGGQRGQGGFGGGMGGGRGPGGASPDMLKELGVPEDKIKTIQAEIQSEMEKMRASMPQPTAAAGGPMGAPGGGGFGPPADMMARQAMQQRMSKMQQTIEGIMKRNMTPEQFEAYSAKRAEMSSQKRATIYSVNDKGELERHNVTVGISDGSYAQIIRGAKEGDKFILRNKAPAQPQK
jgi:HlyD family secretion protein